MKPNQIRNLTTQVRATMTKVKRLASKNLPTDSDEPNRWLESCNSNNNDLKRLLTYTVANTIRFDVLKLRSLLLISLLLFGDATAGTASGLVAKWGFDQCDATDDSGNGHDGMVTGASCVDSEINQKSYDFNGVSTLISYGYSDLLEPPDITVVFWLKPASIGPDQGLLSSLMEMDSVTNQAGCVSNDFGVRITDDGRLSAFYRNDPNAVCSWTTLYADNPAEFGQWHHVAATFNDGTREFRLYVDGELATAPVVGPDAIQWTPDTSKRWRNGYRWANAAYLRWFEGGIDEIRIYDRAISGAEVRELYILGLSLFVDGFESGGTLGL